MSNEELCVLARNGSIDARNQLLENNLAFIQQQANQFIERYGDIVKAVEKRLRIE